MGVNDWSLCDYVKDINVTSSNNTYHHVCLTRDNGHYKNYIDGVLVNAEKPDARSISEWLDHYLAKKAALSEAEELSKVIGEAGVNTEKVRL